MTTSTISAGQSVDVAQANLLFAEYVNRAQPELIISDIKINQTAVALNSISAMANLAIDNEITPVFLKIHIENGQVSSGNDEYKNSRILADSGWPIVLPLYESDNQEYPLLVYRAFQKNERVLFDQIQDSYEGDTASLNQILPKVDEFHNAAGKAQVSSLVVTDSVEASRKAQLQIFFGRRLDVGSRADQWFTSERSFKLPGLDNPIEWNELKRKNWVVNGEKYGVTLGDVLEIARAELLFKNQTGRKSYLVSAHGDDHPGNIVSSFEDNSARVFDPAAAGLAPGSMANAKALAHTGLLPMSGMYYDPKIQAQYQLKGNDISVEYGFAATPVFKEHEALARQIIDSRFIPVFKSMKAAGADIQSEFATLKSALAMCALLTVDTAKLLEQPQTHKGIMLLPATLMFSQLSGLPSLDYLKQELAKI